MTFASLEQGQIKATAFNEMVDNWHSYVEEGRAYYLTGGKISPAKKNFSQSHLFVALDRLAG